MIRNIILPEKFGSQRLFSQRMLSIVLHDNHIRGSVVTLQPKASLIEKLIEVTFTQKSNGADSSDSVTISMQEALAKLIATAGKVDSIRIVIPATMTVIKELDVPFLDEAKIRLIIENEIEPQLPFSLEEAIVDFVVTKSSKELQSSQILAVAIRKQDLLAILEPYEQAGIKVQSVTIDLFATYGLYQMIPAYRNLAGSCALVDIGIQGTRITFLQNNQFKLSRYITKGLGLLVTHISEEANLSSAEIFKHLEEYGMSCTEAHTALEKAIQKHAINFFNEIQFTLNSFSLKLNYYEGVSKILFMGKAANIAHFAQHSSDILQIPSELFAPQKIVDLSSVKNNTQSVNFAWEKFTNALGAILSPPAFENFNLRRRDLALFDLELATKQVVTSFFLVITTIISIGIVGYINIKELKQVAQKLELDQSTHLKSLLSRKERNRKISLPALTRKIEDLVKEKTSLWAPFGQERTKPLEALLEVTQTFDKKQFSLDIEELSLSEKETGNPIIELEGYFRSEKGLGYHHKEWAELEERLKEVSLLAFVEPPSPIPAAEKGIKFSVKLQKKRDLSQQPVNQP